MDHMDDSAIKAEIDNISKRIDFIIKKLDDATPAQEDEDGCSESMEMSQNK